jgi:hypothetical protein
VSASPLGHLMHPDLTPDWCDPVAVKRCLNGLPIGRVLHHAEKLAVARAAHARGDSTARLGRLLGCSEDIARNIRKEATACSD